jgi:FMN phosphatase YigB (HAD superfamily)
LKWAGVDYESFDLVTDYANSTTCKPNPAYFLEITGRLGVDPCKCLMIGNNVQEDIEAARAAGLDTFLLTDCLISKDGSTPADCPQGTFSQLIDFLQEL